MLLRSSSNPALNSYFQHHNQNHMQLVSSSPEASFRSITRASSDTHLLKLSKNRKSLSGSIKCSRSSSCVDVVEDVEGEAMESERLELVLFSSSGLGCEEVCSVGGDGGEGGGKVCGGGGGESGGVEVYYESMIEANPGNALILGNYAKYLKEVRGDLVKAEEYCSRAILANPSDGNALSMYADLIWVTQKDSSRAQSYFDQAIKASPDDCYVMASYARFLWDADEEDEEEVCDMNLAAPSFLHEASQQFPIAAA